jgi:hypothetical protein
VAPDCLQNIVEFFLRNERSILFCETDRLRQHRIAKTTGMDPALSICCAFSRARAALRIHTDRPARPHDAARRCTEPPELPCAGNISRSPNSAALTSP